MDLFSYIKEKKDKIIKKLDNSFSTAESSEKTITTTAVTSAKYAGFDLGSKTSIVAIASEAYNPYEYYDEPTSKLLSNCYPDLELPLPSSIKPLFTKKLSSLELPSNNYFLGGKVSENFHGFSLFLGRNNLQVTVAQLFFKSLSYLCTKIPNGRLQYCIGIPIYFTDLQRRVILDVARSLGGLNTKLLHETSASALAYAYRPMMNMYDTERRYVIFVDMGVTSMQVCVAELQGVLWKVLAHAFDYSLGGRAFDEVLCNHFMVNFREEYGIDVSKDPYLYSQLYNACEKMKIELSSCEHTSLTIYSNGNNLMGTMKREDFERMCASLLERVKGPLEKALNDSGLRSGDIHSVENVGFASQVPAVIKKLTDFFGKQPNQIKEGKKLVSKGCILELAKFKIIEEFPHSIAMSWNKDKVTIEDQAVVFPKGTRMDTERVVSFSASASFFVNFKYADIGESMIIPTRIARFMIGPFQSSTSTKVSGKFKVLLDMNGIVVVFAASISENGKTVQLHVSRLNELEEQLEGTTLEAKRSSEEINEHHENDSEHVCELEQLEQTMSELEISTKEGNQELIKAHKSEAELLNNSKQISQTGVEFFDCEDE
ncbi:hypothetical protein LUZ60_012814 [Juncus effusus]|nr:hypothetical protein LUZ60_012814 [Juncus effusus]